MLLAVEIGLGFFAYRDGWLKEKFKAYGYWLNFKNWGGWFKARQIAQKQRKMGDRALLKEVATELVFDKPNWQSPVLKYIANPILSAYGWLLKKIIFGNMSKITKAILTGGGRATRLRPLTSTINKHLIPLANQPMIFYAIEKAVEAGIKEIYINTNPGEVQLQTRWVMAAAGA